jgi:hypothetical protein
MALVAAGTMGRHPQLILPIFPEFKNHWDAALQVSAGAPWSLASIRAGSSRSMTIKSGEKGCCPSADSSMQQCL